MDRPAPTLTDVARHAGVSYATVDRVVNARGNVAQKSVRRVEAAIAALGYTRNVAAANLSKRRMYRFAVILPSGASGFFASVNDALAARLHGLRAAQTEVLVQHVPAFEPEALAAALEALPELDGVALVGAQSTRVRAAIGRLRAQGVSVVSFVSDLDGARDAYVGIDNRVAGQTAGRLIALAHQRRHGRVLPVLGALAARDHADRFEGLRDVLFQTGLDLCPALEGRDNPEKVEALLRAALRTDPEITAIYSLGAGNAGLIRVLQDLADRPVTILHELTPHSRAALQSGLIDVVIDQRPEDEVALALQTLRALADGLLPAPPPLVPAIYLRDNLPTEQGGSK